MSACLLDVNVLVALIWPAHEFHAKVQAWFARNSRRGWATCPLTQAGFVRVVSNPAFSPDAVTPQEALTVLSANLKHRSHQFWADAITVAEAAARFRGRITGHQQVTDAYLLGLAVHHRGKLATLDRRLMALLPEGAGEDAVVEMIHDS